MFCVNCGKPYDPPCKFCNFCGHPLPSSVGGKEGEGTPQPMAAATVDCAPEGPSESSTPAVAPPVPENAPYAVFVLLILGLTLLLSISIFNITDALARNRWDATISTVVATTAAVLLAQKARGVWHRVVAIEPETDAIFKRRHRRLLRNGAVIGLLFFAAAAIVGAAIGQSGAEAIQLAADLEHMTAVGNRITKARNGVEAKIASYVEMYKSIAPDVQELELTLTRLKTELGIYDRKFPARHEQTSKSIAGMERGLRRAALLKQQIGVAEQIEALDPSKQFDAWQIRMVPILAKEQALQ